MTMAEVLTILLSLTDFGVSSSPSAPTAAEAIRHAPEHADVALHVDLAAFVPTNHRALGQLAAALPAGGESRVALDRALGEIALGRTAVKLATGVDPIDDLTSATGFVALEGDEPRFLVVVRGRFPSDLVGRLASGGQLGGETFEVDGKPGLALGEVAATQLGKDLVLGHRPWIEARMKKGYRRKAGPNDGRWRRALGGKPFFAAVATPSEATRARLQAELAKDKDAAPFAEMLGTLDWFETHLSRTGLGWTVGVRDAAGLERARLWSEAAFDLMRAQQYFILGAAKAGFAVLPALRDEAPEVVDALLPRQAELLALVPALAGDGKFVSRVVLDRSGKQVSAEATARSIGQIVGPLPLLMVAGGLVAMRGGDGVRELSGPVAVRGEAARPAPVRRTLDVPAIHRRVKAGRAR
jgi:hypothetical protein